MSNVKKYIIVSVVSLIIGYLLGFGVYKYVEHKNQRIKLILEKEFHRIA